MGGRGDAMCVLKAPRGGPLAPIGPAPPPMGRGADREMRLSLSHRSDAN